MTRSKKDLPLHLRHRPHQFKFFVGNENMIMSLESTLKQEQKPSSYLLSGPSGCGKTTLSRIIMKELGVTNHDLYEYNISNQRGIAQARSIIDDTHTTSFSSEGKGFILNECHMATKEFWNAMLEVLEEPPTNVYFVLCTTEPIKLLPTIITRCSHFKVSRLTRRESFGFVKKIIKRENAEIGKGVISKIVKSGGGSPRQLLVNLNTVIDLDNDEARLEALDEFVIDDATIVDLSKSLLADDNWGKVSKILKNLQADPEGVRLKVLEYMNKVLLGGINVRAGEIIEEFSEPFYQPALLTNACFNLQS